MVGVPGWLDLMMMVLSRLAEVVVFMKEMRMIGITDSYVFTGSSKQEL
jgi:argininosuccinate lyase